MKLKDFLQDKISYIVIFFIFIIITVLMLNAFKVDKSCIIALTGIFSVMYFSCLAAEFIKKKKFYDNMKSVMAELDNKLLISELVPGCDFTEGRILKELLYETGYCYGNRINELSRSVEDFKEYVEMWIHEVKIPLSSLMLMNYNRNDDVVTRSAGLSELDNYLEQILYYIRADVSDKDYLLKKVSLEEIINQIIVKNKEFLIARKIKIKKENLEKTVVTDSKWMEFIINQILNNSIKYSKDNPIISFYTREDDESVILVIEDNGIGIEPSDIDRVFDKTFTGINGRTGRKSTGMGLYLCRKLCKKLGHVISVESSVGEYTKVIISFGKNEFYSDVT